MINCTSSRTPIRDLVFQEIPSAKPYRGCSFDGPKEPKAPGRNNHPADSLDRRPGKGGKYCGRDASPKKGKKAKQAWRTSWIHSDAPAVYTASESVLWSRKYCLTESGRRGSLFPRRPFATFGPAKVGPRQRRRGDFSIAQSMFSTIFAFAGLPGCLFCLPLFPAQHCSV
jgi:hypothetical protein